MHSNTNPNYAEIRADQVSCLKELLGKRRLSELYHHRERCRKDMLGFLIEYKGDDKSHVHALSRLWLRLLDHTLWNLDNQKNTVFTPDPRLEMSGTIGLCLEWHDFVNFISAVHVLPGYRQWTEEVDDLGGYNAWQSVLFRRRTQGSDYILRPTSAVFYNLTALATSH
jgi:hypothetical protein